MQKHDFEKQIERLQIVYGEKNFPNERLKILWDMFKMEDAAIFERVISKMIAENYTVPPANKIKEAVRDHMQGRRPAEQRQDDFKFLCEPCRDFGFGFVGDVVVACTCDKGRSLNPAEIAKQQGYYDRGKGFFKGGFIPGSRLPYDPSERIS